MIVGIRDQTIFMGNITGSYQQKPQKTSESEYPAMIRVDFPSDSDATVASS